MDKKIRIIRYTFKQRQKIFTIFCVVLIILNIFYPLSAIEPALGDEAQTSETLEISEPSVQNNEPASESSSENSEPENTSGESSETAQNPKQENENNATQTTNENTSAEIEGQEEETAVLVLENNLTADENIASTAGDENKSKNTAETDELPVKESNEATDSADFSSQESQTANENETADADTSVPLIEIENIASASSDTGGNQTEGAIEADIDTGDAIAIANALNLINIETVSSELIIKVFNLWQESGLDLNEWLTQNLNARDPKVIEDWEKVLTADGQNIDVKNTVTAEADTGGNTIANAQKGDINTGDATAIANLLSLINVNAINSEVIFVIINILGDSVGNIILPRPDKLFGYSDGEMELLSWLVSAVSSESHTSATALTGENTSGNGNIATGNAISNSNSHILANISLENAINFFLQINQVGGWAGDILFAPDNVNTDAESSIPDNTGSSVISTNNYVSASANTGGNSSSAKYSNIQTGSARALANLWEFINLQFLNTGWFFGVINIIGDWNGNIIYAYPEIEVGLTTDKQEVKTDETYTYLISVSNKGYDDAGSTNVTLNLPPGIKPISAESLSFSFDNLQKGETKQVQIEVVPEDNYFENQPVENESQALGIIRNAHAAETHVRTKISASATASISDQEQDLDNNSASAETYVYYSTQNVPDSNNENQAEDVILSGLQITAENNVNNYIYPGDTITFFVKVLNTGGQVINNAYLGQAMLTSSGQFLGEDKIYMGNINPGAQIELTFGWKINSNAPAGEYLTLFQTGGEADGSLIFSNTAETSFNIAGNITQNIPQTPASENSQQGSVLAAENINKDSRDYSDYNLALYLPLFLSTVFVSRKLKYKLMQL